MENFIDIFRTRIEDYLANSDISPTALGKRALGDPSFVINIRAGREPRIKTLTRVSAWMDENPPVTETAKPDQLPVA